MIHRVRRVVLLLVLVTIAAAADTPAPIVRWESPSSFHKN